MFQQVEYIYIDCSYVIIKVLNAKLDNTLTNNIEISVNSATCYKNNNIVLKNIDILLNNREVLLITGPNGCGKTTLIESICGIQNLESGYISLNKVNIQNQECNYLDNILYIGHKNGLNDDLTVLENLEYLCVFDSSADSQNTKQIRRSMEYFNISKYESYMASQLSEGNKRRVALARLFLTRKKIWLLDEPLNNLDEETTKVLIKLFARHQDNQGLIVLSSHFDLSKELNNVKSFKMENQSD